MFSKISTTGRRAFAAALTCAALVACAPELNWREVHGSDAHYTVLLPSKPATHARKVDLGGVKVEMSMTGAAVDDLSFVVASAHIPEPAQRTAALAAMQQAMLHNIRAAKHTEKQVMLKGGVAATEVVADGQAARDGRPLVMHARFAAHGDRVLQAVALGPRDKLSAEAADTFLGSLSLQ